MVRQKLALPIVLSALFAGAWFNNHQGINKQAHEGKIAHDAMCAFYDGIKVDLEANRKKRDDQQKYLDNHPDGVPALDLTPGDLKVIIATTQSTIDSQKRRLRQLIAAGLEC